MSGESRAILCTNCRKLISSEEAVCPHCGARRPGALAGPLQQLFRGEIELTDVIVGISAVIYGITILVDVRAAFDLSQLTGIFGLLNLGSPSARALYLFGMTGGVAWNCGHLWTALTATFLHGSLLHIFFNLSWLRMLGPFVSRELGPGRFLALYLVTGVGGFLASNLWNNVPTIGASCAIFGLMGALIAYGRRRGGTFGQNLSQQVTAWAIAGFLISFAIPQVNNVGHAGGFITGFAMAYLFPLRSTEGRGIQLLAVGLSLLTVIGFGLSMVLMWETFQSGLVLCMPLF
ncbi:MAG: rhomboid family intramembrane serine protease [Myxococcota bacterium]